MAEGLPESVLLKMDGEDAGSDIADSKINREMGPRCMDGGGGGSGTGC